MDIYFNEKFVRLHENFYDGEYDCFYMKTKIGEISYLFQKKELVSEKSNNKLDKKYYEIYTPLQFGGPNVRIKNYEDLGELISYFDDAFDIYCENNNIISERITFHPLFKNHIGFESIYNIEYAKNLYGTNVEEFEDPITTEYSLQVRKDILKSLKKGVKYDFIYKPDSIETFLGIYKKSDVFSKDKYDELYLLKLHNSFKDNMVIINISYDNELIGASLYLATEKNLYLHTYCYLSEYIHLSPRAVMIYASVIWTVENELHKVVYNSDEEDIKKFSKRTIEPVYVGTKIRDKVIYNKFFKTS